MRLIGNTGAGLPSAWRGIVALAMAATVLAGCGGGSSLGSSSPSPSPSISDRFSQLFGSKSQAVGEAPPPPEDDLTCPSVAIRPGASTYTVGSTPGQPGSGTDVKYQATITRTARDCSLNAGQITARIGIQGRVIAGPLGAPPSVDVPLRVAVVQDGVTPKTIFTKAYTTNVAMTPDGSVLFSLVAEDIVYPVPVGGAGDAYVFYIGFDPTALRPAPKPRATKKK